MSVYPEHDRLEALQPERQVCGEFLEWLESDGYVLAKADANGHLTLDDTSMERLLADHFDIDLCKIESEKRAMRRNK